MNIDLLDIINKYNKLYQNSEYLNILDNDMSFAINNNKGLYEEISTYIVNNDNIRDMLMLNIKSTFLMEHIKKVWIELSYKKKKEVYVCLMNGIENFI